MRCFGGLKCTTPPSRCILDPRATKSNDGFPSLGRFRYEHAKGISYLANYDEGAPMLIQSQE